MSGRPSNSTSTSMLFSFDSLPTYSATNALGLPNVRRVRISSRSVASMHAGWNTSVFTVVSTTWSIFVEKRPRNSSRYDAEVVAHASIRRLSKLSRAQPTRMAHSAIPRLRMILSTSVWMDPATGMPRANPTVAKVMARPSTVMCMQSGRNSCRAFQILHILVTEGKATRLNWKLLGNALSRVTFFGGSLSPKSSPLSSFSRENSNTSCPAFTSSDAKEVMRRHTPSMDGGNEWE
mmetsp:Transcript_38488/g.68893  ORF Transcript_38488/g.68893 Transcript_38488/m.68893 type:complete len:235 (+) Transcript_38488:927-1631(+)